MGDIRSTLDIIMEKTKGLTMTEGEKRAFQRIEVEGKVRGLLQRFLDGTLNLERAKTEIIRLGEDKQDLARESVERECIDRLDPEADNSSLFDILQKVAGIHTAPFENALSAFRKDMEKQRTLREQALRESLRQRGISGSAVVPNPNADPDWNQYVVGIKTELRKKLSSLVSE